MFMTAFVQISAPEELLPGEMCTAGDLAECRLASNPRLRYRGSGVIAGFYRLICRQVRSGHDHGNA